DKGAGAQQSDSEQPHQDHRVVHLPRQQRHDGESDNGDGHPGRPRVPGLVHITLLPVASSPSKPEAVAHAAGVAADIVPNGAATGAQSPPSRQASWRSTSANATRWSTPPGALTSTKATVAPTWNQIR